MLTLIYSCRSHRRKHFLFCESSSSHVDEYEVQNCLLKRRSTIILHGSTSQKTILNFLFQQLFYLR
jgi:hypothetical protein